MFNANCPAIGSVVDIIIVHGLVVTKGIAERRTLFLCDHWNQFDRCFAI